FCPGDDAIELALSGIRIDDLALELELLALESLDHRREHQPHRLVARTPVKEGGIARCNQVGSSDDDLAAGVRKAVAAHENRSGVHHDGFSGIALGWRDRDGWVSNRRERVDQPPTGDHAK